MYISSYCNSGSLGICASGSLDVSDSGSLRYYDSGSLFVFDSGSLGHCDSGSLGFVTLGNGRSWRVDFCTCSSEVLNFFARWRYGGTQTDWFHQSWKLSEEFCGQDPCYELLECRCWSWWVGHGNWPEGLTIGGFIVSENIFHSEAGKSPSGNQNCSEAQVWTSDTRSVRRQEQSNVESIWEFTATKCLY